MSKTLYHTLEFEIGEIKCKIHNIPYQSYWNMETYDTGVTLKLAMIRELMENGEIPYEVDFKNVEDLEF